MSGVCVVLVSRLTVCLHCSVSKLNEGLSVTHITLGEYTRVQLVICLILVEELSLTSNA
jgi:hypothetical protein